MFCPRWQNWHWMFCPGPQKWHGMFCPVATKTTCDVLSGMANRCGMFCPGCQKMAWDVLSRDVLSYILISLPDATSYDKIHKSYLTEPGNLCQRGVTLTLVKLNTALICK